MISGNCKWFILSFDELNILDMLGGTALLKKADASIGEHGITLSFFSKKDAEDFNNEINTTFELWDRKENV